MTLDLLEGTVPRQDQSSPCLRVKLGPLGLERMIRPVLPRQPSQRRLKKLGFLG